MYVVEKIEFGYSIEVLYFKSEALKAPRHTQVRFTKGLILLSYKLSA